MNFDCCFEFGTQWSYPTVSIISSTTGKTIRCHDTLTEAQWKVEPWYGKLAILRIVSLTTSSVHGRRLWVYTRWGCCHFDVLWGRKTLVMCAKCKGSGEILAMTEAYGPDDYEHSVSCPSCLGRGTLQDE